MIKSVERKSHSGELLVNLAQDHLRHHESEQTRMAIEAPQAKGKIDDLKEAI